MQPMPKEMFKRLELEVAEVNYYVRQVERVRVASIEREPFLATFGFEMEIQIDNMWGGRPVPTCATDGKILMVNPHWYMSRTTGGRVTVFAHELFHAALGHSLRRGRRDPEIWNYACDYEANNLIVASGKYELPTGQPGDTWCHDLKYKGWVAERIYDDLVKDLPVGDDPGGDDAGDQEEGSQEGEGGSGGDGEESAEKGEGNPTEAEGSGSSEDSEGKESEDGKAAEPDGSSGDGSAGSKYSNEAQVGLIIDSTNDDGTEMSEVQKKEALQELAKRNEIGKLAEITAGVSNDIGHTVSMEKLMNTEQDWESQLGDFFQSKGTPAGDTWKRLNRRGLANKVFIPGKRYHGIEWMVFGYDVSSSMDRASLTVLNHAMDKMRVEYGVERVTIVPFNTSVIQSQIKDVGLSDEFPNKWDVGGGTSFKGLFNWVRRQDRKPDGIIVFTDMGSREYGEPVVGVPTLWASSEPFWTHGKVTNRPPFGEELEIDCGNHRRR